MFCRRGHTDGCLFFSPPDSSYLFVIFHAAQAGGASEEKWNQVYSGVECSPAPIFFEQADNHSGSLFLRKTFQNHQFAFEHETANGSAKLKGRQTHKRSGWGAKFTG